jgi:eukaryotic-like serine/threonine-protein kinase
MARDTLALEAMAGTILEDKYKLGRILGSGAMAHVYEAEQLRLGRSVAVKIMRVALASDRRSLDRFRTEALAASRINHPNAIAIYDVGVTRDRIPFLVMERLRGTTLAAARAASPFPVDRIINIGAQVLSALDEAHELGVVHRDLKSENVVLEPRRDGSDFVKVLDFGIAAFVGSQDQSIVGTPEYMAPEQIRGEPPEPSTDLYSMGIMLYEMVTGRTPFAGAQLAEMLELHLLEVPEPPEHLADCPEPLSTLIMRALAKEPGGRFASAREMRGELLGISGGTQRACRSCGARLLRGVRFCSACGADLSEPPTLGPSAAPRLTLALGSGPAASAPTDRARATRLTFDLSVDTGALVGRAAELAELDAWLTGPAGTPALAVIGGHGAGKARLVLEAVRRRADRIVTFIAAPDPSGHQQSWYPVLSMLEAVLGLAPRPSIEDLVLALGRGGLPSRDAPGLAELFGLVGPLATLELAVRRRETFAAAVRALLSVDHRHQSGVLCFIDVDRYDHSSRKLIELLVASVGGTGLRILLTSTQADAVPTGSRIMPLLGLAPDEGHAFLSRIVGGERSIAVPPDELHAITAGLPAHIQHLAGWLGLESSVEDAPPRLVDLVASRLGRLPAPARRLLQVVAAHGQVATRAELAEHLADLDPSGSALGSLVRAGLAIAGPDEITIPLALVAQVAEACTPAETRRELSREILGRLGTALPLVVAAHHAEAAEDLDRALRAFVSAGDDAVRRFDDPRAAALYHRAITIARRQHAAGEPHAAEEIVEVSLRLADVLRYMGELPLAAGCLDEAELIAPDHVHHAGILRARGRIAMIGGSPAASIDLLRRAIGLAFRVGDTEFLCDTYLDLAAALSSGGGITDAVAELAEAVDALTLGEGLARAQRPLRLWLLGLRLAALHQRAGDLTAAHQVARDALLHAERTGSAIGQGRLHAALASILEHAGDAEGALAHQAKALEHMRRLGDRRTTAELLVACARVTAELPPTAARRRVSSGGDSARRAMDIAHQLAAEIGWKGDLSDVG